MSEKEIRFLPGNPSDFAISDGISPNDDSDYHQSPGRKYIHITVPRYFY